MDIQIVDVEQDGSDGILVTFSDGTFAGYVIEELIELRPVRQDVERRNGKVEMFRIEQAYAGA